MDDTPAIETLAIQNMKKDLKRGAEDIESFGLMFSGLGQVIFSCGFSYFLVEAQSSKISLSDKLKE